MLANRGEGIGDGGIGAFDNETSEVAQPENEVGESWVLPCVGSMVGWLQLGRMTFVWLL